MGIRFLIQITISILALAQPSWAGAPEGPPPPFNEGEGFAGRPQNPKKSEGGVCLECESSKDAQIEKLKSQMSEMQAALKKQNEESLADAKEHANRLKERIIRKIKSGSCQQSQDGEDEMGAEDFMAQANLENAVDAGPSRGGKGPGPGGPQGGANKSGGGSTQNLALTQAMQDDIQDAIDAKAEKCQKQKARAMAANTGGSGNAGMMNLQQQGQGMGSMMGGGGIMNMANMGGMSSMTGMGNMMGMYGMNTGMNSMSSMMGMSGLYGFSRWNPYSSYFPTQSTNAWRNYGLGYGTLGY